MMNTMLILSFCIVVIVVLAIFVGIAKQKLKQHNQALLEGERIDEIIRNNTNITDDEWDAWLQERSDKQK